MASYTRQSTFSDGDLITAALFNDEYNQLLAAFDNATGHKHDGTVGEGPVISVLGDAGLATPLNKILIDTTNDHIEFWIDVSGTSTQQLYIADGAIVPVTDNDIDLGTNSLQFKDLYINGTANIDTLAADSVDINGGNIDGTVIGATTAAAGTFTTIDASGNVVISGNLTVSGTTTSVNSNEVNIGDNILVLNSDETGTPSQNAGIEIERGTSTNVSLLWNESNDYWTFGSNDLNFPDSSKAKFGTGNDLQIYHDGNHSYIADVGTGNLRLLGNDLRLQTASGAENYLKGDLNGAVTLYYDNSAKLATTSTGIDVTGTVTSDGLTVNSGTTDTVATFQSSDQFADLALTDSGGTSYIRQSNGSLILEADRANAVSGSALVFQIDGSNVARFTSDGRLGIGETTPSDLLHINKSQDAGTQIQIENQNTGTSSYAGLNLNGQGNNFTIKNWGDGTSKANATEFISTASGSHFIFSTQSTERARIDSSGNLLIGQTAGNVYNQSSVSGFKLDGSSGNLQVARSGGTTAFFNRMSNDGTIVDFRKNGTAVGEIGTNSGYIRIGTDDTHLLYHSGIDTIIPYSGSANRDNAISLGYSGARFKDLHLAGTVNFGSLSDGTTTITGFVDEDNMSSNSATLLPTQQSVKAYVDSQISSAGGNGISFEDNEKAQFGDGNDLQIYHSGVTSFIKDAGVGNLEIWGDGGLLIKSGDGTEFKAKFITNDAVELYYNNSKKFETTSTGIDVTGVITTDGITTSADINFGDDDKALFGAGNDLKIYHSANNQSYIHEVGSGDLNILATNLKLQDASGTERARIDSSGNLFVGGTSTTNAQGWGRQISSINSGTNGAALTLKDSNGEYQLASYANNFYLSQGANTRFFINSSGRVGIGTSSPSYLLHIDNVGGGDGIALQDTNDAGSTGLHFLNNSGTIVAEVSGLSDNTGMTFETSGSERMRIDSSGNVGINTSSPAEKLTVLGNQNITGKLAVGIANAHGSFDFYNQNTAYFNGAVTIDANITQSSGDYLYSGAINFDIKHTIASQNITFHTTPSGGSATERMRIKHDGNIGIGTASPSTGLHLSKGDGSAELTLERTGTYASSWSLKPFNADFYIRESGTDRVTVKAGGNVGIGTTSPSSQLNIKGTTGLLVESNGSANYGVYVQSNYAETMGTIGALSQSDAGRDGASISFNDYGRGIVFKTNEGSNNSEKARIDASGNFLIGTTTNAGSGGVSIGQNATIYARRTGGEIITLRRDSTDGALINFQKDGTTVGSIGTTLSSLLVGTGAAGLLFSSSNNAIMPRNTSGANADSSLQLGTSGSRFTDLHLSGTANIGSTTSVYEGAGGDAFFKNTNSGADLFLDSARRIRFTANGSERMRIDSSGNLGLGTSSPSTALTVVGDVTVSKTAAGSNILSLQRNGATNAWKLAQGHTATDYFEILEGNDVRLTIKNGGNVGIGTSSPNATLEVATSATTNIDVAHFSNSNGAVKAKFHLAASTGDGQLTLYDGNNNADVLISSLGNSYLNSGGRLGLNTTNPTTDLEVNASGANGIKITSDQPYLFFNDTDNSGTTYDATISFSGDSLYIGGASAASIVRFRNKASFGESARFDTSGNLLVGTTDSSLYNNTTGVGVAIHDNHIQVARSGGVPLYLNRQTSDGTIAEFRKDGSVVGSINTINGDINIGTGDTGFRFHDGSDYIEPYNISTNSFRDNAISLGTTGSRFKDLHLSGNVNASAAYIDGYIYHTGDTDTNIVFSDDTITLNAGGQATTFKGNGRVGIGTTAPTEKLHVEGNIEIINNGYIGSLDGNYWQRIRFEDDTPSSTNAFNFETRNGSGSFINHMTITNNGDVGIGTTSPTQPLTVTGVDSIGIDDYVLHNGDGNTKFGFNGADSFKVRTGGGDRFVIGNDDSYFNNNLGINTSSPTSPLTVKSSSTGSQDAGFTLQANGSTNAIFKVGEKANGKARLHMFDGTTEKIAFYADGTANHISAGNLGIGTSSPSHKLTVAGTTSHETARVLTTTGNANLRISTDNSDFAIIGQGGSNRFDIYDNNASATRLSIDSSGNLLVGKTSSSTGVAGARFSANGFANVTRDGAECINFNRLTSDGTIIDLRKDSTTKGNIGSVDSANGVQIYTASGNSSSTGAGLRFVNVTTANYIAPCRGDGSYSDNLIDLGISSARFDDIYATNGTIQTSDRNEKQDIQALTDAEQRVATACKGLIRRYKFNSAVTQKGDDARYHFGIIAQDLQDAFTAEGLDAGDYGMFISETWTDDNGVEQTRLGVRYNELLAFIIATL